MRSTPSAEGRSCPLQHTANSERDALPAAFVLLELSAAGCRQRVVLGVPVVLAGPPLSFQLAVLFEAVERREQGTGIDPEMIVTERGQSLRQAVAVQGLAREDCKNHQLERPLRDVDLVQCLRVTLRHNRRSH